MSLRILTIVGVSLILLSGFCIATPLDDANAYGVNVGYAKCGARLYSWEDITFSVKKACGRIGTKNKLLELPQVYAGPGNHWGDIRGPFYSFSIIRKDKLLHRPGIIGGSNDLVIINEQCKFTNIVMKIKLESTRSRSRLNRSCPPGRNDCEYRICELGASNIPGLNKKRPSSPSSSGSGSVGRSPRF